MAEETHRDGFTDRRKHTDILVKVLRYLVVFAYIIIFAILMIAGMPELHKATFYDPNTEHIQIMQDSLDIIQTLFVLLLIGMVISSAGLVINAKRTRRQYDEARISLIFLLGLSVLGIGVIAYLFLFWI